MKKREPAKPITQSEIDDIIRLRDENNLGFPEIAVAMSRSISSVRDAYKRKRAGKANYVRPNEYVQSWPPLKDTWVVKTDFGAHDLKMKPSKTVNGNKMRKNDLNLYSCTAAICAGVI